MIHKILKKVSKKYYCEKCDYYANRKSDLNKHFKSKKHNDTNDTLNDTSKFSHTCICGKTYKYHTGLSRHKKKCTYNEEDKVSDTPNIDNATQSSDIASLLMKLIDTNKDLKEQILDLASKPRTVNNQNTFNLNTFLNVDCKDAMNLTEFLEQISFSFNKLLELGNNGFIESFNDVFIKKLTSMEQTKRPIHCTDQKRKNMLVKDKDKWLHDKDHEILVNAIDSVNRKQIQAFSEHKKQRDEDFLDDETNLDNNNKIIIEMCGYNKSTSMDVNKKLVSDIAKSTTIKKQGL